MNKVRIKPYKISFQILMIDAILAAILIVISIILYFTEERNWYIFLLFLIPLLIMSFSHLRHLEYFEIDENKLVVKNIFGIVNSINWEHIVKIDKITITITDTSKDVKDCYFFYSKNTLNYKNKNMNFYNNKGIPIKIYVNDQITELIKKYYSNDSVL